jgi:hypothetical protein
LFEVKSFKFVLNYFFKNTVGQGVSGPGESEFPEQEPAALSYPQVSFSK